MAAVGRFFGLFYSVGFTSFLALRFKTLVDNVLHLGFLGGGWGGLVKISSWELER
jgi:hypothetical protein